jgi:hypothetical protein
MNTHIYSCEYDEGNKTYAMHIYGTIEEVTQHAEALGLSEPRLVEAIIPIDFKERLN